jgi:hypothetical protein
MDEQQQGKTVTTIETKPSAAPAPRGSVDTKVTVTRTDPIAAFGRWSAGLVGGFIRGGAHAITSGTAMQVLDPGDFNAAITGFCSCCMESSAPPCICRLVQYRLSGSHRRATDGQKTKETINEKTD